MMRSAPLKRRTPLKPKREMPRRGKRILRRTKNKSAAERAHHGAVAAMACVACGARPVEVHHVVSDGFQRLSKCHRRVLPVCPEHHRTGKQAIHRLGHGPWNALFEIDQVAAADSLWAAR